MHWKEILSNIGQIKLDIILTCLPVGSCGVGGLLHITMAGHMGVWAQVTLLSLGYRGVVQEVVGACHIIAVGVHGEGGEGSGV
jgi:hypothetical protein